MQDLPLHQKLTKSIFLGFMVCVICAEITQGKILIFSCNRSRGVAGVATGGQNPMGGWNHVGVARGGKGWVRGGRSPRSGEVIHKSQIFLLYDEYFGFYGGSKF